MLEYDDRQLRMIKHTLWGVKFFLWFYIVLVLAIISIHLIAKYLYSVDLSDCRSKIMIRLQYQ